MLDYERYTIIIVSSQDVMPKNLIFVVITKQLDSWPGHYAHLTGVAMATHYHHIPLYLYVLFDAKIGRLSLTGVGEIRAALGTCIIYIYITDLHAWTLSSVLRRGIAK